LLLLGALCVATAHSAEQKEKDKRAADDAQEFSGKGSLKWKGARELQAHLRAEEYVRRIPGVGYDIDDFVIQGGWPQFRIEDGRQVWGECTVRKNIGRGKDSKGRYQADTQFVCASILGSMASPLGQGAFLATFTLIPGRPYRAYWRSVFTEVEFGSKEITTSITCIPLDWKAKGVER
jgi:hypothetical protein